MKKLLNNTDKNFINSLSIENYNYLLTLNPNKLCGGKNIIGIKNELLIKNFSVKSDLSTWIENNLDMLNQYFLNNKIYQYKSNIILERINKENLTKDNYNKILKIIIRNE